MRTTGSSANWATVKNLFTWVSIGSAFTFAALMLAKAILWLLNYTSYPFKRQMTVIAIVAFSSLASSGLVVAAPSLVRGFLRLRALIPTKAREIGATIAMSLVAVLVATLWFSPTNVRQINSGGASQPKVKSEAEQQVVPEHHDQRQQGTQQANTNSMPLSDFDDLQESQPAPDVLSDESKAPQAEAAANVAVLRNGSQIPFIRKEESGDVTHLYIPGGHMDIPTKQIASFEEDDSPATLKAIASVPTPKTADAGGPSRTAVARPATYNSLPTGTRIREDNGTSGHGELTVENGTDEDAVVRLYDFSSDQTVRWFFVKAKTSAHIAQIPSGIYKLAFTSGLNWVEPNDSFSWHPSYSEFERTLDFREETESDGTKYHEMSVTLNPVPLGNVHTKGITRDEFMRGHHHVMLQR